MKKLIFLLSLLAIISCDKTDPDNPYNAQFNSRGCLECDIYGVGEDFVIDGIRYIVADRSILDSAIDNGDDLSKYCTSKVTNMDTLFLNHESFNQDIASWDVSNVTTMWAMFYGTYFNQDIGNWDVGNVTIMGGMFSTAYAFNQDISNWDVSSVTDMRSMFYKASSFNQDIGSWNVNNVTNMGNMFGYASSFNQDIGDWFVGNVTYMNGMFKEASSFNQDLTQWCVSNFSSIPYLFSDNSALTASNHPVWGTCP
jgi:surface protein